MKISRKMKKFLVSFLTVTLSIIMFVTQTSALSTFPISEWFIQNGEVNALEHMAWSSNRNVLTCSVDLTCYENDNVDRVFARLDLWVTDTSSSSPAEPYYDDYTSGNYDYLNTWDSDELILCASNFNPNLNRYFINAKIKYIIYYNDGGFEEHEFEYMVLTHADGNISYTRIPTN